MFCLMNDAVESIINFDKRKMSQSFFFNFVNEKLPPFFISLFLVHLRFCVEQIVSQILVLVC